MVSLFFFFLQLFDHDNPVNKQASKYIFTTEGHFFKLDKSLWKVDSQFLDLTKGYKDVFTDARSSNLWGK